MNAAQLERLQEQMQRLRLVKTRERLEALLQEAAAKELSQPERLPAGGRRTATNRRRTLGRVRRRRHHRKSFRQGESGLGQNSA